VIESHYLSEKIYLPTEQDVVRWVNCWASFVTPPLVMAFIGEIGAGKTTTIRAMLRALGIQTAIKSPTFSLVESYNLPCVHHFDLYRIHDECELELIGFRDYFTADAVCCIEWPERAPSIQHLIDVTLNIQFNDVGRDFFITAKTFAGERVLEKMHDAAIFI
jgi:tRNA threonylcarbamoyladenosine biosynthesis protein TsaE